MADHTASAEPGNGVSMDLTRLVIGHGWQEGESGIGTWEGPVVSAPGLGSWPGQWRFGEEAGGPGTPRPRHSQCLHCPYRQQFRKVAGLRGSRAVWSRAGWMAFVGTSPLRLTYLN